MSFFPGLKEGEALEVFRGGERESGLEKWRRLAALDDRWQLDEV